MLEIISQIAWILSLIVAIIGLLFIKPIYRHFKNTDNSFNIHERNTWNTVIVNNWNYVNESIVKGLSSNAVNNGK
jgi:hypothetical protein